MKTYQAILTKSYIVGIKAKNKKEARYFSEFFTGNILDISKEEDRKIHNFSIDNIECTINDVHSITEVKYGKQKTQPF